MSIVFDSTHRTLTLTTRNTSYQMQIGPLGHLLHLYYGRRAEGCFDYLHIPRDCGFSPNPYELRGGRAWSLDLMPQEYSGANTGDFRIPALRTTTADGVIGTDLRYLRHEIRPGACPIPGLPAAFAGDGEAETLSVTLGDDAAGLTVELLYGVFPERDVITRSARIVNSGKAPVRLEEVASACLDIPFGDWDLIHFHGRHTMERQVERTPLLTAIQSVSSRRGASSHQQNPFVILCDREATEDAGDCYGMMLVYSGSHRTDIERDQTGSVRAVMGLQPFSWTLAPGDSFDAPQAILAFTSDGLTALSHLYHRFLRRHIIRSKLTSAPRPVLLNSWEAAYFDFNEDTILSLARGAKDLGADLLVLDDGWFGSRNSDRSSLGDWFASPDKLPGGLEPLIRRVNDLGLRFGLWVEPEMVSEDSDLFRAHPDWALTVPGRKPTVGRDQLVLDLSRRDVVDYLYRTLADLLGRYHIEYIKWDMNRHLTDLYSHALPAGRQGEVSHRYVLGLYDLLERLTTAFPHVLFEGCSGGGGRFDAGMLAYCPQIWCSDNTDPIARLEIQYGTSFGYPISAVGSHVSASPNHQTGRTTPLGTRYVTALAGTFGYELDPKALSDEEKAEIRQQIRQFRLYDALIRDGDYYRLRRGDGHQALTAWQFVSPDRRKTLVGAVLADPASNPRPMVLRLKGLDPQGQYTVSQLSFFGCRAPLLSIPQTTFSGAALMYAGYPLPPLLGDYPSVELYLTQEDLT